jgi:uncharacterized protein with PIN domain
MSEAGVEADAEAPARETPVSVDGTKVKAIPDRLVFDTEPLVAHATSELGKSTVDTYLDAVRDSEMSGFINYVNLTETRYVIGRESGREVADRYIRWLLDIGVQPLGIDSLWAPAADYILEHNPALGDSFALASADSIDASLLVGGDDDYDSITDVRILRFREGASTG